jgi:hypothetical protein
MAKTAKPKPKTDSKRETVTWRFKPATVRALRQLADRERRSFNTQAELVIEAGLESLKNAAPAP